MLISANMKCDVYFLRFVFVWIVAGIGEHGCKSEGGEFEKCDGIDIHEEENRCNRYLGEIGTAILASDGKDYTDMCR